MLLISLGGKVNIGKSFKGEIGVHLVASKFFAMNYIALPTSRNVKGYDIVVFNPQTNKGVGIQVKCTDTPQNGFPMVNIKFSNYREVIKKKILAPCVFVDISNMETPKYFIVPKDEVARILMEDIQSHINRMKQTDPKKLKEKMRPDYPKPDLWTIELSDIEKYKNNWKAITDLLI